MIPSSVIRALDSRVKTVSSAKPMTSCEASPVWSTSFWNTGSPTCKATGTPSRMAAAVPTTLWTSPIAGAGVSSASAWANWRGVCEATRLATTCGAMIAPPGEARTGAVSSAK